MTGSNTGNNYKIQCTYNSVMEGMGREKGYGLDAKEADISAISKYCSDGSWPDKTSKFSKKCKNCSMLMCKIEIKIKIGILTESKILLIELNVWKNHGF